MMFAKVEHHLEHPFGRLKLGSGQIAQQMRPRAGGRQERLTIPVENPLEVAIGGASRITRRAGLRSLGNAALIPEPSSGL